MGGCGGGGCGGVGWRCGRLWVVVDGVAVVVRKAEVVSNVELVGGVEVCGVGGGCCRDCGGMGAEGWWVVWGL